MQTARVHEEPTIADLAVEKWQISGDDSPTKNLRPGTAVSLYHGLHAKAIMMRADDFARLQDKHPLQSVGVLHHLDDVSRAIASLRPTMPLKFEDGDGHIGMLVHPADFALLRASALLPHKAEDYRRRLTEGSISDWGSLEAI